MAPTNTAAWLPALKAPLEIKSNKYTSPGEGEITIKVAAIAFNPADPALQDWFVMPGVSHPLIPGEDVAGTVEEVGTGVTRFQKGDRVAALAFGTGNNRTECGGFQQYVVLHDVLTYKIPNKLPMTSACVLPLGMASSMGGLFEKSLLGLQFPQLNPTSTGKVVLVWGGASSVGCNGIQLATAAGFEVITTCSQKNFDLVKRLGAKQAFDYNSSDVAEQIVKALEGKALAGALNCAGPADKTCEIVARSDGAKNVASSTGVPENVPEGVNAKFIFGVDMRETGTAKAVYVDFLEPALAQGKYIAAPEPWIIGKGFDFIQKGMDEMRKGVSAKKIVVEME